jgi:uncharacterized protein (TIGR03083 family)
VLSRDEIVGGTIDELREFGALVRSLDGEQWTVPSRCERWTVADVAGHLVGAFADILAGRLEGQGTDEVSERQAAERRGRSPGQVADELDRVAAETAALLARFDDSSWSAPIAAGSDMTIGLGWEAMWTGTYVHADDVRAAVGRPTARGAGLRAAVHYVADTLGSRGWGPAVLALDGIEEIRVGEGSDARRIEGDAVAFVLAATGRADPAPFGLDASVNVYA